MSNELNITELKYGSSNPKTRKSSDTKMADLPIIMRDECAIETTFDGNKRYMLQIITLVYVHS